MSEKRDAEYWILKFTDMIKSDFNTRLALINSRKDDGITLATVNNSAYYYLTFGQGLPAYDPCVIFGVDTEVIGSMSGQVAERVLIATEVVISDKGEASTVTLMKRIQRYRRALQEIILASRRDYPNLVVENLDDIRFTRDGAFFFALGVGARMSYPL
jgi:hypothetical protein